MTVPARPHSITLGTIPSQALRIVLNGLFKMLKELAVAVKDSANKSIDISLPSSLCQKISGGHDLTVSDAVCLLVAIPTTIPFKSTTGKKPSDLGKPQSSSQASTFTENKPLVPHGAFVAGTSVLSALFTASENSQSPKKVLGKTHMEALTVTSAAKDSGFWILVAKLQALYTTWKPLIARGAIVARY